MACSVEAGVGLEHAYKVLFKGKKTDSHATKHVLRWCKLNGFVPHTRPYRRGQPEQTDAELRAYLDGRSPAARGAGTTDAALARAEAALGLSSPQKAGQAPS